MYSSYYCCITNRPELRVIRNNHFITLMNAVDQELGKGTEKTNVPCSTVSKASAGNS